MDFAEYSLKAHRFAIYPEEFKIAYPALKLCGEAAELEACLDDTKQILSNEALKEAGDVFWYINELCLGLDLSFPQLIRDALNNVGEWEDGELIGNTDTQSLFQLTGGLAENVGKLLRDGSDTKRLDKIHKYLYELVRTIVLDYLPVDFHITDTQYIEKILQINFDKLSSRQERGVLRGDGDNR